MIKAILNKLKTGNELKNDLENLPEEQKQFVNDIFIVKQILIEEITDNIRDLIDKKIVSITGSGMNTYNGNMVYYSITINKGAYAIIKKYGKL